MNGWEARKAELRRQHRVHVIRSQALAKLAIEQLAPTVTAAPKRDALDQTVYAICLRAIGWAHSLCQLPDPFDFQAHSAGCRSLFEIAVDLVLLTKAVEPLAKFDEWERLARYRSAEHALRGRGPLIKQQATQFLQQNAAKVTAARTKFWPNAKRDPLRWTGNGLFKDALRADRLLPRLKLGELARDHYERLCWGTHGSNLILVRYISETAFPGLSALALFESFNLLAGVTRLVLEHFGLWDASWEKNIRLARDGGLLEAARRNLEDIVLKAEGEGESS